ncbi:protein ACCELERATED CELL DEATH 6-like [Ananas comosus]|uniref:Protein ACCELERATED CELL DEATH 6-like n=2 Tax=Ananas comosus TaxID=4615 RepID=A0A6P5H716_ANACO|nr:protein ACCELERATED CELL DEATH 6-like [Ananas comosus]
MERCGVIHKLINRCRDMDELVDNQGRNVLHIAVQDNRPTVVKYVCRHRKLERMMNARDNRGNTPLHLAVSSHNQKIVSLLVENGSVHPSIKNKCGRTPLDLAIIEIDYGLISIQNPQVWIFHCLQQIGAICGPQRLDRLIYENITVPNLENELKKYESTAQNLVIVSVLIATVTFAADFTMPGGNIADDHQNGGTPTLARKFAFKAFIVADFVAFLCSIMATIWLMYAGSLAIHPSRQAKLILRSENFIYVAAQSMMATFALSAYLVLAPVNILVALAVCVFAFPSVLLCNPEFRQRFRLAVTLKRRLGWSAMCEARLIGRPFGLATKSFNWFIFRPIVCYLLVYIFIFGFGAVISV